MRLRFLCERHEQPVSPGVFAFAIVVADDFYLTYMHTWCLLPACSLRDDISLGLVEVTGGLALRTLSPRSHEKINILAKAVPPPPPGLPDVLFPSHFCASLVLASQDDHADLVSLPPRHRDSVRQLRYQHEHVDILMCLQHQPAALLFDGDDEIFTCSFGKKTLDISCAPSRVLALATLPALPISFLLSSFYPPHVQVRGARCAMHSCPSNFSCVSSFSLSRMGHEVGGHNASLEYQARFDWDQFIFVAPRSVLSTWTALAVQSVIKSILVRPCRKDEI